MDARLKNALKLPESWPKIEGQLLDAINAAKHRKREAEEELRELEAWKQFHKREKITAYGEYKIYVISDGESHRVAARSADEALRHHAAMHGYLTIERMAEDLGEPIVGVLPPERAMLVCDVDGQAWATIKTNAEWAMVTEPSTVSTTVH